MTSSTTTTTTTTTTPVALPGQSDQCLAITLESTSWIKLSTELLTHPSEGRCHVRILFSTFSNGLLLRKFDWNEESISLVIIGGKMVLKMATGSSQEISVSSSIIVTDGLEHTVIASFGTGYISLKV